MYPQTQKNKIQISLKYGIGLLFRSVLCCHDAVFNRHEQCTHFWESDNEHFTKGPHFLSQYHKASLGLLLRPPIGFVLAMMIVLDPYVLWFV